MQSTGRATGLALAGAIITTMTNFGLALLVAGVSAEFAGIFFTATALTTILGNTSSLGTMTGLVYFLPRDQAGPRGLITLALTPVALTGTVIGFGAFITAETVAEILTTQHAADLAGAIRACSIAIPAWAIAATMLGATRGLGSMKPTVAINQVAKPLAQLAAIGVVVSTGVGVDLATDPTATPGPAAAAVALAWSIPVVGAALASAIWVWRLGGFDGRSASPVGPTEFWAYTRPRAVSTGFQIALERVDVVLVSALAGPSMAGIYGGITRFITAGNFLIFSIAQATAPTLRRALASGRRAEAQALLHKAAGWMVLLAWPYFLLVAVKAETFAILLNPDFARGANALALLAIVMLVHAATGPIDSTLLMLGHSKASLAATAAALTIDVGLAFVLVPQFGLVGAALAWGAAVVIQNGVASVLVARIGQLHAPGRAALTGAGGAVLAVVPVGLVTPDSLVGLSITAIAATPIYLSWAVRFATTLHIDAITNRVSPRERNELPVR